MGELTLTTAPTFKVVGIVLGEEATLASRVHFEPRLKAALATLQRLRNIDLPASVCSLFWRTDVLPKALYGSEVRDVTAEMLRPLSSGGKAALGPKHPLLLNEWRAPEVLTGPPFGDSAVRDPLLEVRERQLRWMHLVCNMPGLVGDVHRAVAWAGEQWCEPSQAFQSALRAVGWSVRRNPECVRAHGWPVVAPEGRYPAAVVLQTIDDFPEDGAVFTDGSVIGRRGGAAAVRADGSTEFLAQISSPRSSTHCELAALVLALQMEPRQILSDSLAALTMVARWGTWSMRRLLACRDRVEVRQFLDNAAKLAVAPALGKVKAHDIHAVELGHPRAVGNDLADRAAKRATLGAGVQLWGRTLHATATLWSSSTKPVLR